MKSVISLIGILFLLGTPNARAEISTGSSLSSDNFRILDSQHGGFGGIASSSSDQFRLTATIGDIAIGSSSITSFAVRSGFLYFPKVTAPTLNSATAGNAEVALAWSAATAFQGWSIGGYNRCFKVTSGGTYSCENVGNVTSSTKTGLSNGTEYTFKIEAKDGLGNVIATSNELSATPTAPAAPPPSGGGGGGGGGYVPPSTGSGSLVIRGAAYPNSTVNTFIDNALVASIRAGGGAKFEVTVNNVGAGQRTLSLNSEDANGRKSVTTGFVITIVANTSVTLSDVVLAPTIDVNATRLVRGDTLRVFGQAGPLAEINVHVASEETITKGITDNNGAYAITFDTKGLIEEDHTTKSRSIFEKIVSPFSQVVSFLLVGTRSGLNTADLNKLGRVNIIDFSILLFWWNTKNPQGLTIADINKDGKVNVVDFSIMLFQWTG